MAHRKTKDKIYLKRGEDMVDRDSRGDGVVKKWEQRNIEYKREEWRKKMKNKSKEKLNVMKGKFWIKEKVWREEGNETVKKRTSLLHS